MGIIHVYSNIQNAIDNASKGDLILVHKGIYKEKLYINTDCLRIVAIEECVLLDGKNVVNGNFCNGITIEADGVEIKGFKIKNYAGNGIAVYGDGNRIVENHIEKCDENGVLVGPTSYRSLLKDEEPCCNGEESVSNKNNTRCGIRESKCNLIYDNVINECGINGIKVVKGPCTVILCNKVKCCQDDGIDIRWWSTGCQIIMNEVTCCNDDGIDLNGGCNQFVSDNKVKCNSESGIESHTWCSIIQNNVVTDNKVGIDLKYMSKKNTVIENKVVDNCEEDLENKGYNNNVTRNCEEDLRYCHCNCNCNCNNQLNAFEMNCCKKKTIVCDDCALQNCWKCKCW